jgi:hypothetical protein
MAAIPRKKMATPATLFIHHILFSLNRCLNRLTNELSINHHDAEPINTPITIVIIEKKSRGPALVRFTPANMARKKKIAIGFDIVRKNKLKKSS